MAEPIAELERARLSADRQYNDTLSALDRAIVEVSSQQTLGRDDLARLTTALIVFLQQITAFVETKDRELDAQIDAADRDAGTGDRFHRGAPYSH